MNRPLYVCRKKLSMQYSLKLSSTTQNPAYSGVFNGKLKSAFDRKPNQIPPLGTRVEPDLHAIGFKQKDIVQSSISVTPPWLLDHPHVNLDVRCFHKEDTPPEIYRSRFHEICSQYDGFHRLYTDGLKVGDQVASSAVTRNSTKAVRLANKASIFRGKLYAITLAMDFIRRSKYTMEAVLNKVSQLSPQSKQNNPITNNGGFVPFYLRRYISTKIMSRCAIEGRKSLNNWWFKSNAARRG